MASAAAAGERDEQRAVLLLDRALEQRLGHRAGARVQREPAAAVVARGRDAPDPAAIDGAQPHVDLGAGRELGEAVDTSATWTPGPVVDRRVPLAAVPVEAPAGDAADERDDVRVVGEGEDDDRRAVGVAAQLDVGAFLDQLHPPSTVAGGAGATARYPRAAMATGTLIAESIRLGAAARRRSRSPRRAIERVRADLSDRRSAPTGSPRPGRSSRSRSRTSEAARASPPRSPRSSTRRAGTRTCTPTTAASSCSRAACSRTRSDDAAGRAKAEAYARAHGVPDAQIDWP